MLIRGYEVGGGNEIRFLAGGRINHNVNSPFPCRVKIDAWNSGKNIEAFRVTPKAEEVVTVGEIAGANTLERRVELGQRGQGLW